MTIWSTLSSERFKKVGHPWHLLTAPRLVTNGDCANTLRLRLLVKEYLNIITKSDFSNRFPLMWVETVLEVWDPLVNFINILRARFLYESASLLLPKPKRNSLNLNEIQSLNN